MAYHQFSASDSRYYVLVFRWGNVLNANVHTCVFVGVLLANACVCGTRECAMRCQAEYECVREWWCEYACACVRVCACRCVYVWSECGCGGCWCRLSSPYSSVVEHSLRKRKVGSSNLPGGSRFSFALHAPRSDRNGALSSSSRALSV